MESKQSFINIYTYDNIFILNNILHDLGFPLGVNSNRISIWVLVINKIVRKLAFWKERILSMAGRVKSCLFNMPIYYLLIFKIFKLVAVKIESLLRSFLWNDRNSSRKLHLINRQSILQRKSNGGLEISNILLHNHALLFKQM